MSRKLLVLSLCSLISFSSSAFAHNGVEHKGMPIEGIASNVATTGFKVKTESGEKDVQIDKETVFEVGIDGTKGKQQDLKDGLFVMVEGTTLESGVLVASEVMVHSASADGTEHKYH